MLQDCLFAELLCRVRQGDAEAAVELVHRYESAIRVAVRTRLSDPALRRHFDSMDISQSVLASFFLRAAAGQYDLENPAQLVALLTKMARNKLAMQIRGQSRECRNLRRAVALGGVAQQLSDTAPMPVEQIADRELVDQAYQLMDPQVRRIASFRADGAGWSEIAAQLGGTPEARRKQFRRAMNSIAHTLQIE
jgi:RNA polymerase sigma factor (sigma-70 family)